MNLYLINDYSVHDINTDTIVQFENKEVTIWLNQTQRSYSCSGNVCITFEHTGPMIYFEDASDCLFVEALIREVERLAKKAKEFLEVIHS